MAVPLLACGFIASFLLSAGALVWEKTSNSLEDENIKQRDSNQSRKKRRAIRVACRAVSVAGVLAASTFGILLLRRRASTKRQETRRAVAKGPRIPLRDVVRFREKSWFIEELENARDGDPNSMLRLAKMYLYGQGCERNVNIAVEWLRKARALGVPCSLDELLTAEDLSKYRADALKAQQRTVATSVVRTPACISAAAAACSRLIITHHS